ncbi:MAG TPA: divergent polysaccharide deacetylase family protein [Thermoanaerobaculia bacterium]|nr:divergent polysaccharide deacetylase family protein [Thermoanaerobaculia bacterium]
MAGREGTPHSSFRTIAVLTLVPVVALLGFVVWWLLPSATEHPTRSAAPPQPVAAAVTSPPPFAGSIVLILDDFGFDGQPIERAMQLDPDINFAILPNGNRATDFAHRLNRRGFEVLCHLPMEPIGPASPGRNAILTSMTDEEIIRVVRENLRAVPHARGVNNHMGSRATADRRVMATVLGALPDGMYFVDSRTGSQSVAEVVAREMRVRTAARHVFLDDVRTRAAVRQQLAALASMARERGVAVGIAHPHQVTLDVLAEEIPRLRESGFRFLRASSAVN